MQEIEGHGSWKQYLCVHQQGTHGRGQIQSDKNTVPYL